MKRALISFTVLLGSFLTTEVTNAQSIATCKSLSGYTLYHDSSAKREKNNGFEPDQIKGSVFTIKKIGDDSFDVLFLDTRGSIFSLVQMGGVVRKLRSSENEITLVHLVDNLFEIYTVYKIGDKSHMDLTQSRGMQERSPKSNLLTGDCDFFNPLK